MKYFVSSIFWFFVVTGLALVVIPARWWPSFYDIPYMGWSMLGWSALIISLPEIFKVSLSVPNAMIKNRATELFQFLLAFAFLGDALGSLGLYELYKVGFQYDKVLHFFVPALSVVVLVAIFQTRLTANRYWAVVLAFLLTIAYCIDWEFFEYVSDQFFSTHLLGVFGSDIYNDTKFDLIFGSAGSVLGMLFALPLGKQLLKIRKKMKPEKMFLRNERN